ncbi:hypothetical protein CDIK_4097 [Cucumispora dikerogammari]|nr:hypothetical protein CDIK_4097 [Cucumispora dikerogammari]
MFAILINSSNLICTESECKKQELETNLPTSSVKLELQPYYYEEKDVTVEYDEDADILKATFDFFFYESFEGKISSFEFTLKKYEKPEKRIRINNTLIIWKPQADIKASTNSYNKGEMGLFFETNIKKIEFTLEDEYPQIVASASLSLDKSTTDWHQSKIDRLRADLYIFPGEDIEKIAFKIEAKFTIEAKGYETTNVICSTKLFGFKEYLGLHRLSLISNITPRFLIEC